MPTNAHKKRYRKDIRDAHREYVRERKKIGYTSHPTYHQYQGVIVDFFKEIFRMIVEEGFTFITNIGTFTLAADKRTITQDRGLAVDIKRTIDNRKKYYHINDHTHGYIYKIAWIKDGARVRNI